VNIITNFLIFEARIRDIVKLKGFDDNINKYINSEFNKDVSLLKIIILKRYNKKLYLKYNNTEKHNFIKRIENRTGFKTVSEFNEFLNVAVNKMFNEFFNDIDETGKQLRNKSRIKISLYIKEYNFYLIFMLDYKYLYSEKTNLMVLLIIPSLIHNANLYLEI